jgi:transposase
MPLSSA